jgi:hypothetical protein
VAERDATEAALREVSERLRLGMEVGVDGNPCGIFYALLRMHGLTREPTGGAS